MSQESENTSEMEPKKASSKISFEELNRETMIAKEEKKLKNQERFNAAYIEALNTIVNNYDEKLKEAASNGRTQAILYEFEWTPDRSKEFDNHGVKITFQGNVKLLDILIKGGKIFKNMLDDFFNEFEESKPYHCGFYKKFNEDTKITKWYIFVNWDVARRESRRASFATEENGSFQNNRMRYGDRNQGNGREKYHSRSSSFKEAL
jgi:hypothetical protein